MRLICFFLFVFLLEKQASTQVSEEFIRWSEKKLTWDDFDGPIIENSEFDALTFSAISLEFQGENVTLSFEIEAIFDPLQSWKKEGVNAYILKHEQLHFDITEYHSRILKKDLQKHRFKSFEAIESDIKRMFEQAYTNANKMQDKYDKQTNHSLNRKAQNQWNKKVKSLLSKTKSYKKTSFTIKIDYLL